jgi:hypothetical protein
MTRQIGCARIVHQARFSLVMSRCKPSDRVVSRLCKPLHRWEGGNAIFAIGTEHNERSLRVDTTIRSDGTYREAAGKRLCPSEKESIF